MRTTRYFFVLAAFTVLMSLSACLVVAVSPIPQSDEIDQTSFDRIRGTVREARNKAGEGDFPTAFQLLDLSGAHIDLLLNQVPQRLTLVELKEWYIQEYSDITRECELYAEAVSGLPGIPPPVCRKPPVRGPTR